MLSMTRRADQDFCREDLLMRQLERLMDVPGSPTLARISLRLQPGVETKICQFDDNPSDQTSNGRYVDEPAKDHRRVIRNVQIYEGKQHAGESHCVMGSSEAVAALEYLRRMTVAAQTVQCPGSDEYTSRSAANGGCADNHVDD